MEYNDLNEKIYKRVNALINLLTCRKIVDQRGKNDILVMKRMIWNLQKKYTFFSSYKLLAAVSQNSSTENHIVL